jgi:acyl homoserine lactone synthase
MFRTIILNASHPRFAPALLDSMYVLRRKVFHDRLSWAVQCDDAGRERDDFDELDPYYLIAYEPERPFQAIGCWRLLPSTGPYMLRDIFPVLLGGHLPPNDLRIWEISRFAMDAAADGAAFGFSQLPADMLRALVRYAVSHDIDEVVGVTSVAVERMLWKLGFDVERFAPPQRIGRVMSVGFRLPMNADVQLKVCGEYMEPMRDRMKVHATVAREIPTAAIRALSGPALLPAQSPVVEW